MKKEENTGQTEEALNDDLKLANNLTFEYNFFKFFKKLIIFIFWTDFDVKSRNITF